MKMFFVAQKLGEVSLDGRIETSAWKQALKLLENKRVSTK